jgi:TRAP-type C4-dicarboxylate transport system substrate-binding protein
MDLVPADWWDNLTDQDRRQIENAVARSEHDVRAGR